MPTRPWILLIDRHYQEILTREIGTAFEGGQMRMKIGCGMGEAPTFVQSAPKETRTVMDGVLSSHAKALALKVQNDSTDAWAAIDTERRGDSGIGMIETWKKGLPVDLIPSREKRTGTLNEKEPDEMGPGEAETNPLGLRIRMRLPHYLGIGEAMERGMLIEVEDGEKRSVKTRRKTVG
jgi:hypothetical protein